LRDYDIEMIVHITIMVLICALALPCYKMSTALLNQMSRN